KMSGNAKRGGRGGRQTRSSSCNSQAGGSRPTSPENQFTFSAPKETATHQESIWKTYQKKPQPTSDKKMTEAMEAERKATEKSKAVAKELSRNPPLPPQNIVNNVNGTNKVPTLNKEIVSNPHKDQQQSVVLPNQDKTNLQADQGSQPMDVDPSNLNKDPSIITIEKVKEHIALVPYGELIGGKGLKTIKIKKALQTYNIQYNKQLPVTPLGKQRVKVSFLDKEKFDQFLKMELVIQEQKEGDSGEVFNVKLQPTPLKPEKVATTNDKNSDTSQNSNSRTIQVIDIPAYRQVREIRESFEDLGEIEKIYTRGAGLYQSYHINKNIVRVLPLLLSKEEREKRKQFSLRLSGLHYQTSGYDLKEVMTQCKGKTCFIPAVMIQGKYQRCRYAYIHFSSQDDLVEARQMKIEFKKGNANCTNKDINKSQSKRFVGGADNWKNLKKLYADAAKSKQKPRNSSKFNNNIPSGSHKMLKMESLIGDTGKQISEVVTAQQALKCDKAHPVPTSMKKKNQQSVSGAEVKAAKKRCKSDSESSEDEDELANKSVLQSQQFQKSDQNIQSIVAQQKQIQENHKETKSLLSSLYNMLAGGPSASSLLGDNDEVFDDSVV
ncbi:4688_t:CDS:2, partial [Rhizophagus irregularis]